MVTKLKNITFILENCDAITIDGKYVGEFLVDDIKINFRRLACNCIEKRKLAGTFVIEIHKDANKERYQFSQTHIEDFKQMTFDRLKENDITSVEFELEEQYVDDGEVPTIESYGYGVLWSGESDFVNESQTTYISKDGHLYITIAENKGVEDFFDLEQINDSDYMDFHFDMCDIGDEYSDPDRYNNRYIMIESDEQDKSEVVL